MTFRIPIFIRRDFPRKLVALFFAVLIWFAIANQLREFELYHDIPITLTYPPDKVVLDQSIHTVNVTLQGSRRRLEEVKSNDIRITAEVPVRQEGVYYYDLRLGPDNVNTPPGTKVAQIEPQHIRIQVDRIISKEVPVKVRETGDLAYGYRVVDRTVVPSRLTVTGPSKIVKDIEQVMTESVVLDEAVMRSFELDRVKLLPIPNIDINPASVHIAYEIDKHSGQRAFNDLEINILNKSDNNLRPKGKLPTVAITVRGPKLAIEDIQEHNIHPFVDISSITAPGRYNLPVQAWIDQAPRRIVPEYIHPETVPLELIPVAPETPAPNSTDKETDASDG